MNIEEKNEYSYSLDFKPIVEEATEKQNIEKTKLIDDYLDKALINSLNDEVEIIEEDKDIEELNVEQDGSTYYIRNEHGTKCYLTKHSYLIAYKVNELIREINKLKNN